MKKKGRWQTRITKKQFQHIKETTNRCTLKELVSNIRGQRADGIRCWECEEIARQLGLNIQ